MTARTFPIMDRFQRRRPLRIAHRGASAYAPENSLLAFHKAAEMGADMVEIDVRMTAEEIPVVSHDESLQRVFGINKMIGELTLAELQHTIPTGFDPIPTFAAVAEVCAELKLGLYLDIKEVSRTGMESILESLIRFDLLAYSIFGSFRPDFIAGLKTFDPRIQTSILFGSTLINPVYLAKAVRADFVHPCWENAAPEPHKLLTLAWINQVRAPGLGIICWHEERPAEITALAALGVDGICSDTPDVLTALTSMEF